ncbi:MAG: efflux RND transporter permease subunit [Mailhella sp.]|nr:efflux RND transporter permease subunit [Mailhella sp.]
MRAFVGFLLRRRLLVLVLVVLILISGLISYGTLPKQQYPTLTPPVATVSVVWPGASAEEIARHCVKKIEKAASELDGFDETIASCFPNYGVVTVKLDANTPTRQIKTIFESLQLKIDDMRTGSDFPAGVTSAAVVTDALETAALCVALTSDKVSAEDLYARADSCAAKLRSEKGVFRVEVLGDRSPLITITVDSRKLDETSLSMAEVASLVTAANTAVPLGSVRLEDETRIALKADALAGSIRELENIIIGYSAESGTLTKLGDIAEIRYEPPRDDSRYLHGDEEAVLMAIYMDGAANILDINAAVEGKLREFERTLPESAHLHRLTVQAENVGASIGEFIVNLLESIAIVLAVVMLGAGVRGGMVVSLAVPLAICAVFVLMRFTGWDIQFVSLASFIIALGMLVDNSIVVSDAIQYRINAGEDRIGACGNAVAEVFPSILSSTIIICAVFACFFGLNGSYRTFALTLPQVVISSLVFSLATAVVITPVTSFQLLKKAPEKTKRQGSLDIERLYEAIYTGLFRHKKVFLAAGICFLALCGAAASRLDMELLPKADKDVMTLSLDTGDSLDIAKTERAARAAHRFLLEQPEVRTVFSAIGTTLPRYDFGIVPGMPLTSAVDTIARLDIEKGGRFKKNDDFAVWAQRELEKLLPSVLVRTDVLGIIPNTDAPVEIRVLGGSPSLVNESAGRVKEAMEKTGGFQSVSAPMMLGESSWRLGLNEAALTSFSLNKAQTLNEISLASAGREITSLYVNGKAWPIRLESTLHSQADLLNFRVKSSITGNKFAVRQFADLDAGTELSCVSRFSGQTGIAVKAYPAPGFSPIALMGDFRRQAETMDLPSGVELSYGGDSKYFNEIAVALLMAAALASAFIFLLLLGKYGRVSQSLMVFISVPFGMAGGLLGIWITGQTMSFAAILGLTSLLGCVLSNAIVMIDHINAHLGEMPLPDLCRSAGARRLRPILMSSLTTVLGVTPLVISGNTLFAPLAITIMAGLFVSMLFTLFLIPMTYCVTQGGMKEKA